MLIVSLHLFSGYKAAKIYVAHFGTSALTENGFSFSRTVKSVLYKTSCGLVVTMRLFELCLHIAFFYKHIVVMVPFLV
jgi:hypothetical protein